MLKRIAVLVLLAGCSAPPGSSDSGVYDSGVGNSGGNDSGVTDSGTSDSGVADGGQTTTSLLRVHYPAGTGSISLRGSGGGLSWTASTAATLGTDDTWTLSLSLSSPIEWKPLLNDTTWSRGPNYHLAPGETLDVYPHFTTQKGTVTKQFPAFASTVLGNNRDVWVYLPAEYVENSRVRLPVLYAHDGQNLFDSTIAFGGNEWKIDEAFDTAGEAGTCDNNPAQSCQNDGECSGSACHTFPMAIVIGVGNTSARIDEYTPTYDANVGAGGKGDDYLQMLVTELKPAVDAALRTKPERENTLILGSSLGGLISAYAGLKKSLTFGRIGAMSPSTWWDGTYIIGQVDASNGAPPRPLFVYLDCGDSGPSNDDVTNTTALAATYRDAGFVEGTDFHFVIGAGDSHNEVAWAKRFPGAMRTLLGKSP